MVTDNGFLLKGLLNKNKAFFDKQNFRDCVYYIAYNRAAKRLFNSNKFINRAKRAGLTVDLETKTIV